MAINGQVGTGLFEARQWEKLAPTALYKAKNLARLCRLSSRQLQREFRRFLERSPQDWLNEQRIIAAEKMLLAGIPVKVVALELNFKQASHFCRHFKSWRTMTPSEFVLKHRA